MTEQEWMECADPQQMLKFLGADRRDAKLRHQYGNEPLPNLLPANKASDRKLRLFACASVRRIWHLLAMDYSRIAVGVAEECADGIATVDQMTAAFGSAYPEGEDNDLAAGAASSSAHPASDDYDVVAVSRDTATLVAFAVGRENSQPWMQERSLQSQLLRCVVGNPFRPVAVDPPWLTSNVSALALGIYDERAFDRMPILADALEDAGCTNGEILAHCRGAGPHVRGCWVVDLLLGKE